MNTLGSVPFPMLVSMGSLIGFSNIHKFGRNPEIDTSDGFEAIWDSGDDYTGHNATVAEIVEIFSSDAADAEAGTGARTVKTFGLDANYNQINEIVTLNGTTPVDTVNSYIRLDRLIVQTAGSGDANAGTITARQKVTTANVFASLPIGYNQTMIGAYTIPAGHKGFLMTWFAALAGKTNANCNIRFLARPFGQVFQVKEELTVRGGGSNHFRRDYWVPKGPYEEKTDLQVRADTDANNTAIAAGFDLTLLDYQFQS